MFRINLLNQNVGYTTVLLITTARRSNITIVPTIKCCVRTRWRRLRSEVKYRLL